MANAFAHIELSTPDLKKATNFYKKLFKWKLAPVKGMPYTMIDTGKGKVGGGMQPLPMAVCAHGGSPYVPNVDDVQGTLAKAAKAGARVVVDYQELPGMGAIGMFVDPTGALLRTGSGDRRKKHPIEGKEQSQRKRVIFVTYADRSREPTCKRVSPRSSFSGSWVLSWTDLALQLWPTRAAISAITHRTPQVVVEPQTDDEVQAVVRFAAQHGVPVCARGLRHSQMGRRCCEQSIISFHSRAPAP